MHKEKSSVVTKLLRRPFCSMVTVLLAVSLISASDEKEKVREIILSTQHLGAHGMGYNLQSVQQMSQKLTAADVPILLELFKEPIGQVPFEKNVHVGVQFALASLCDPRLEAVMNAVRE